MSWLPLSRNALDDAPAILHEFSIRASFTLEAKIIEPTPENTNLGLFLTINTKWRIHAPISALQAAGIDLAGLYVVRRNRNREERRERRR